MASHVDVHRHYCGLMNDHQIPMLHHSHMRGSGFFSGLRKLFGLAIKHGKKILPHVVSAAKSFANSSSSEGSLAKRLGNAVVSGISQPEEKIEPTELLDTGKKLLSKFKSRKEENDYINSIKKPGDPDMIVETPQSQPEQQTGTGVKMRRKPKF